MFHIYTITTQTEMEETLNLPLPKVKIFYEQQGNQL